MDSIFDYVRVTYFPLKYLQLLNPCMDSINRRNGYNYNTFNSNYLLDKKGKKKFNFNANYVLRNNSIKMRMCVYRYAFSFFQLFGTSLQYQMLPYMCNNCMSSLIYETICVSYRCWQLKFSKWPITICKYALP